jgi:hypothetical protein
VVMRNMIKLIYKLVLLLLCVLVALYYLSFYLLPAVTIINNSAVDIAQADVDLPSSHLDFGAVASGELNRLHYDLTQQREGQYRYKILFANSVEQQGSCGYLTNNEFHKRVVILVARDGQISCNAP